MAQVKGSQMIGVVKGLRGLREQLGTHMPAHLEHYLSERLIVGAWYPERDFADLMLALGRVIAPTVEGNVWRYLGQMGAVRDFSGIYSALVRVDDPAWTVRQLPQGWRLFRDSAELVIESQAENHAEITLADYIAMSREMAEVNAGYFEGALTAASAKTIQVVIKSVHPMSARYELRWS